MSSGHLGLVKFPDGTILAGRYNGTSDIFAAELVTLEEFDEPDFDPKSLGWPPRDAPPPDDAVPVEVWTIYGGGFYWPGQASLSRRLLVDGNDPWPEDHMIQHFDGDPDWLPKEWLDE